MRVITGQARGMKLLTLEGLDVRPTADMVKEAIFSMIQFEINGSVVLDLFAGSGQLGIEALSRGADSAVFVDSSGAAEDIIKKNLLHTKLSDKATLKRLDALSFLKTSNEIFDIAFLDPPYKKGLIDSVLPVLTERMSKKGVIICESSKEENIPEASGNFIKCKEHKYGKIKLTVLRPKEEKTDD